MADLTEVQQMENTIAKVFEAEDREFDLRVVRFLRIRYPHLSTAISDLDRELAFERRKKNG